LLAKGIDPGTEKRKANASERQVVTFSEAARQFIEAKRAEWKNDKHAAQWGATLKTYADPVIGDLPVDAVTTEHVLSVLTPIWNEKTETASRVRGRIKAILDCAKARGWREGENPAVHRRAKVPHLEG